MARSLHHRGPDASGVHVLPGDLGVFAHTRLRIIDLSERASQPFVSEDRRVVLTYNGEIYNFQSLRARLESAGAHFTSSSDTEVILQQYRSHGLKGLDALDGMFAFGLWDADQSRLILMRDRIGKKPLYWTRGAGGELLFASEIKALLSHPSFLREMAVEHLPEYLTYGYVSTPNTLYRGVHRLPPGCRLVCDLGQQPRIECYWSLDDVSTQPLDVDVAEAKDLVRDAVSKAVRRRLISDVPIGAFLSGGIDSSVIVAEMAKASEGRVRTFAVGFSDDETYDETRYAREVARRFDTEHEEIIVRCDAREVFDKLLYYHDEPYGDSSAIAVHAVAEATRKHVTVVLTGDGGDEVFGGYTRFRGALFADVIPSGAARVADAVLRRLPEPRGYKNPVSLLRRFVEHHDRSKDEQLLAWNSFFAGAPLRELLQPDVFAELDPWSVLESQLAVLDKERGRGADRLAQVLRHNLETYLLDDLLVKTDRMTMAVSLEARSPFLDTALIELAFRLPSSLKIHRGELKWILREAYREVLPPSVLDRKKHGFGVPVGRWWSGELAEPVNDLLLSSGSQVVRYLRAPVIEKLVADHRSGRRDHGQRIFALIQLELWLRSFSSVPSEARECA